MLWRKLKYYRTSTGQVDIFENYLISSTGKVRNKLTSKLLTVGKRSKYKDITVCVDGVKYHLSLSVAMCSSFKSCPQSSGFVVDHVDKNMMNNSLDNLRFISISGNLRNRSKIQNPKVLLGYTKNSNNDIVIKETICLSNLVEKDRDRVVSSIRYNNKYKGLDWCLFQESTYNRIQEESLFNLKDIISYNNWKLCYSNNFSKYFISDLGIVCRENKNGIKYYTFGNASQEGNSIRYYITFDHKVSLVSRLVAKYFINGGKDIDSQLEVDHIDNNPMNNHVSNLLVCDHAENMNNKITKQKRDIRLGKQPKIKE